MLLVFSLFGIIPKIVVWWLNTEINKHRLFNGFYFSHLLERNIVLWTDWVLYICFNILAHQLFSREYAKLQTKKIQFFFSAVVLNYSYRYNLKQHLNSSVTKPACLFWQWYYQFTTCIGYQMLKTHGKHYETSHLEIVHRFPVLLHCLKNLSENSIDPLSWFLDKYNCNHERKPSHVQFLKKYH